MNTSSKYWKDRWEETVGYTLAENFSGYDVICARINYGFEMDFGLERHIEANFSVLGTEEFWAAVVSPLFSIYDDWREYKEKGYDFHNMQLMEVVYGDYPLESKQRCVEKLREIGSPYVPLQRYERPRAPRFGKRYEVKSPETKQETTDDDPLAWMDEDDFWGFDKQEHPDKTPSENLCTIVHKEDVHEKFLEQDRIVKSELKAFIRVGKALKTIRDQNLYQEDYGTFEEYCFKELGWKRRHAYYQIDAYEVSILLPEDKQPLAETHVRELTPLAKDNNDAAVEVWNKVNKEAEEEGRKITAKDVKRGVEEYYRVSTSTIESIDGYYFQYPVTMSDGKKAKKSHQQLLDMGYTEDQLAEYRRNND